MIRLIKILALGFLNLQIFWKLVSTALAFARVNVGAYKDFTAEILMIIYAITLFVVFRNLGIILLLLSDLRNLSFNLKLLVVGRWTLVILFLYLILETFPEFAISSSYQIQ